VTSLRRKSARSGGLILGMSLSLFWAAPLRAACDPPSGRWVALEFLGDQDAAFMSTVSADVRAGLAESQIALCSRSDGQAQTPLAEIEIEPRGRESVNLSVQLRDGERESHVTRDVELASIPHDSRAFAVALAIQELLGADWVGPGDVPEPPPRDVHTPEEQGALAESSGAPDASGMPLPAWRLSAGAAAEHFLAGQTQWGGDLGILVPVYDHLRLRLIAGARRGLEVDAAHGRVSSRGLSFTSDVRYLLWQVPFEIGVGAGVHGQWIELRGIAPVADATARELSGLALYAQASGFAALHVGGRVWLEAGAALGAPLRGLEATDDGETASGASSLQLSSSIAVSLEL
jgi:hypothetical protein